MNNDEDYIDFKSNVFYKLRNKRKLATILKIDYSTLQNLTNDENYRTFVDFNTQKTRNVEEPKGKLKIAHHKIKCYLQKIQPPDWIMSGVRGKSYIDNARNHRNASYYLKADINSFYTSCSKKYIFKFFKDYLETTVDVAMLLADLLTYNGYIPTGSPSSQIIAFWAYYPTFNRIYKLAKNYGASMTLYVDDFTFSSDKPIPGYLSYAINGELKKVGLKLKRRKTKQYSNKEYKVITGVAISPTRSIKVPNKLRNRIIQHVKEFEKTSDIKAKKQLKKSLLGMMKAARQIEPSFMENKYLEISN